MKILFREDLIMKRFKTSVFALILVLIALCVVLTACEEAYSDWEITTPATCTEKGEKRRYSKSNKELFESEEIPALGHDFGEWTVLVPPSETEEGTEIRICSRCDHKEYRPIDMLQAKAHIDVMDGDKLLYRENADEDGSYSLEAPQKPGYSFEGFIDGNGDEFPARGTIEGNVIVSVVWKILPTTTFAELKERAGAGVDKIFLDADIEITGSVFFVATTQLYVEENRTLTRGSNFKGDMFVLGETENGDNVLLSSGEPARLTLTAAENTTLTIDGNKENVSSVKGTAFLILNSSTLNMYDGVSVINCQKTGNDKLLSGYAVSYPGKIGGAAMIVVNGTFNMYGGSFSGNEVNLDETNSGDDESENLRESSCGGAIYNYSTVNMYGGSFEDNKASRGGAIYNYRTLNVYEGEFSGNTASVYAGAIYLPGSQYTTLTVGKENETDLVSFNGNVAVKSGGAIFGQMKNSIIIYGGSFTGNISQESNGGAINTSGALTIKDATFSGNKAASKGGAIYVYYSDSELTVRQVEITKGTFENNEASKGGAIAFSASSVEFEKGSIGFIGEVTFTENHAFATESEDPELSEQEPDNEGSDGESNGEKNFNGNGGAIYIARNSDVTVDGATFISNNSDRNGGAIYVTGSSEVEVANATLSENTTDGKGGAIYVTGSATVALIGSDFDKNVSGGNGGAVYCYTGTELTVDGGTFSENKSNSTTYGGGALYFTGAKGTLNDITLTGNEAYRGGALSAYSASIIDITDITASENTATDRGGVFYFSGATVTMNTVTLTENSATDTAGAIAVYSGTQITMTDITVTENSAGGHGGALYFSESTANISDLTANENSASDRGGVMYVTSSSDVEIHGIIANGNSAKTFGGAIGVFSAATLKLYDVDASENSANQGGFLYLTTTDTKVYIYSGSAMDNTATGGGSTIWSNTNKAYLYIKGTTNKTFFDYNGTIEGKLNLKDIEDEN